MKMIEGFKVKIGTLCISSVLRDITNHMLGVNYGEEIYYGLGCGLFFAYTMSNEVVGLGGFTDLILDNLRDSLTLTKVETYAPDDVVFDKIRFSIDAGLPVLVSGLHFHSKEDLALDTEATEKLDLPMNYHYTIIAGYDDETRELFMADNKSSGNVSYENFLKFRDHRNMLTQFLFPPTLEHLDARIYAAIRKLTDYWYRMPENPKSFADVYTTDFLHLSNVYNTMEGLENFRKLFLHGPEMESLENFQKSMFFIQAISYRGTGGDMTRGLYSRFLREGGAITGEDKMLEVSKLYATAAREWRKFFKIFDGNPTVIYEQIKDETQNSVFFEAIEQVYQCEMTAMSALNDLAYGK